MFQVEFTAWMYLSVLGADFFFFLEIKLFWEIYLGHASFPCFPQIILTLHFLPLQLFFFPWNPCTFKSNWRRTFPWPCLYEKQKHKQQNPQILFFFFGIWFLAPFFWPQMLNHLIKWLVTIVVCPGCCLAVAHVRIVCVLYTGVWEFKHPSCVPRGTTLLAGCVPLIAVKSLFKKRTTKCCSWDFLSVFFFKGF